jgi:hypothetical protein
MLPDSAYSPALMTNMLSTNTDFVDRIDICLFISEREEAAIFYCRIPTSSQAANDFCTGPVLHSVGAKALRAPFFQLMTLR